jgi:hypothetical protein
MARSWIPLLLSVSARGRPRCVPCAPDYFGMMNFEFKRQKGRIRGHQGTFVDKKIRSIKRLTGFGTPEIGVLKILADLLNSIFPDPSSISAPAGDTGLRLITSLI